MVIIRQLFTKIARIVLYMFRCQLEFANPVCEMYGAMQRQYTQVRTIKLQGKAQDYV